MNGTITRLTDKGFGFISAEGQEKDIFFHHSQLVDVDFDQLKEGDNVQFETEQTPKGLQALNVTRV